MKCNNCEGKYRRGIRLVRPDGRIQATGFCCYQCYLDFWTKTPGFVPLKQYKQTRTKGYKMITIEHNKRSKL